MSRHKIALPDEDRGWILRTGRKAEPSDGRDLSDLAGSGTDVIVGVPAWLCTIFSLKVPTTDSSLFPGMVASQIERRGLSHRGESASTPHQFRVVEQSGEETWLSVDVLSEEFPDSLCLPRAEGYAPSGRLFRVPEGQLVLWREHNRLVLSANRLGNLVHLQVLSCEPELGAASAQEINLTTLSLQAEGLLVDETPDLIVAGPVAATSGEGRRAFEKALLVPCDFRTDPLDLVSSPQTDERFLPLPVREARLRRARARRRTLVALAAAAVYAVAGTWVWLHAKKTEATIAGLEARVEEMRPEVAEIQETEARWRELEPAMDLHYYPLVQLNEFTRVMPGSGVLVREYETKGRDISISGSARDVQMAFRLKEDLEKNPFFKAYAWSMPQPRVERNNMATFQIQGRPKNEGTDN